MNAPLRKVAIDGFAFFLLILALLLAGLAATNHPEFAAVFVGAWIVFSIVQEINRSDDPRHAKPPPDPH